MKKIITEIINDFAFPEGSAWVRRDFSANATIVKEGEVGKSLFFIESGLLRVSVDVELDERRSAKPGIGDMGKDDLFGDTCLLKSGVRTATVIAITDGCLLEINGETLSAYLNAHPIAGYVFYKRLFEVLFDRLSNGNRRIQYLLAWGLRAQQAGKKGEPTFREI